METGTCPARDTGRRGTRIHAQLHNKPRGSKTDFIPTHTLPSPSPPETSRSGMNNFCNIRSFCEHGAVETAANGQATCSPLNAQTVRVQTRVLNTLKIRKLHIHELKSVQYVLSCHTQPMLC